MKKKKRIMGFIGILILGFTLYCHLENRMITTTRIEIGSDRIPAGFEGFRIIQISDLHNASFGKDNQRLIAGIKKLSPDVIFITGDMIDANRTNIAIAADFAEKAVKIAPVYYVTGNHEAAVSEYPQLKNKLQDIGVTILDHAVTELEKNGEAITIAGLADPGFYRGYGSSTEAISLQKLKEMNMDLNQFTIVLSHRPEIFDFYVQSGIDLVFSGHAHGGQFRIPFVGGVIAPNQGWFPKYTSGVYEKEKTRMIVSRGLGNSIIPVRINNNPEIVAVTLLAGNR